MAATLRRAGAEHKPRCDHPGTNDSPRYSPDRDKRITDALRFLHDRRVEAEQMCALWESSRPRDAAEQLHYWQGVSDDVQRHINRLASPHEYEEHGIGRNRANKNAGEHGDGESEGIEVVERRDE